MLVKTNLSQEIRGVKAVYGITAKNFCQSRSNNTHPDKCRVFCVITLQDFSELRAIFANSTIPYTDLSAYSWYGLNPQYNNHAQDGEWAGVGLLLKMQDSFISTDYVLLKIQRETSQEGVEHIGIYAYPFKKDQPQQLRRLTISEYGAGVVPHYDPSNLPFFALHWERTSAKYPASFAIEINRP